MNASALVSELERRAVSFAVDGDRLIVKAPRGVVTRELHEALTMHKQEIVRAVRATGALAPTPRRPLVDVAADLAPRVRLTIRETGDIRRDFDLVGRVRQVIREFQPGGNHIFLTIVTLDRRRVVVEWRALAVRDLRIGIGRVLAAAARKRGDDATR